jgi:glycosyltransferase involved in cell wall biosynthesis
MRIGIVVSYLPDARLGGAQVQAWELARRLAGAGHRVAVYTRRAGALPRRELRDGVRIVRVRVLPLPLLRALSHVVATALAVCRDPERPEALLCFTTRPGGLVGLIARKATGIPFCTSIRGGDWYFLLPHAWGRAVLGMVFRGSAAVIVQSETIRRQVVQSFPRTTPTVVPNGIDAEPGAGTAAGGRLLFVGNLIPRKGVDVLLRALRERPHIPALIVGDGPLRAALERTAAGLDARFAGAVEPARVRELMAKEGRLLVLPAVAGEGLPNVLMEAMTAGLPVIASNLAGIGDLLEGGRAGVLVPPGDAEALGAAIDRLWSDGGARAALAEAGRAAIRAYSWERVLPLYEQALLRCAAARPASE